MGRLSNIYVTPHGLFVYFSWFVFIYYPIILAAMSLSLCISCPSEQICRPRRATVNRQCIVTYGTVLNTVTGPSVFILLTILTGSFVFLALFIMLTCVTDPLFITGIKHCADHKN